MTGAAALLAALTIHEASAAVSETARLPRPRPGTETGQPVDAAAPLPRPRPADAPDAVATLLTPPDIPPLEPVDTACLARLRSLGVAFTEEAPIDPGGTCNVDHPLKVTALGAGVALTPEAILNCRTTEALAKWVRSVVLPAAASHLGAAPTGIVHSSTYVCRTRNNVVGAKISEHAHANAVDIAALHFDDRAPVEIGHAAGGPTAAFEAAIRRGACNHFTTVLGPGSNAAHANHLHFDMAERKGGYRLCELGPPTTVGAP